MRTTVSIFLLVLTGCATPQQAQERHNRGGGQPLSRMEQERHNGGQPLSRLEQESHIGQPLSRREQERKHPHGVPAQLGGGEITCRVVRQESDRAVFARLTCHSDAYAVTRDGGTVGGQLNGPTTAFLWTDDRVTTLGPGRLRAVADDGTTAVGLLDSAPGPANFGAAPGLWRGGQHGTPLENLVGQGRAITPDGRYAAGFAWGYRREIAALRWDLGALGRGATVELGSIGVAGSGKNVQAVAISNDGQVVVGTERIPGGFQAFLWTGGAMRRLLGLEDAPQSSAIACNADCSIIGGLSRGPSGSHEAVRWLEGRPSLLFSMPNRASSSNVWALDATGNVAAGEVFFIPEHGRMITRAYLWDAQRGFDFVDDLATQKGLDLGDWKFWSVAAMSADGRVLVGRGAVGDSQKWNAYRLTLR
ncbi:MAG: hypothetical protein A2289_23570 [Deltaproteobacteria bacterium RIFOXYA12_FULL_58_15]|nr:MAG: hypothetical protein A2289_23570 [Deltaproteobacteria bacterium RIFOXYA12_FULL_58_15]OGR10441.1 MAG: hypothetical protein A2341_08875 [Deltaproteobacteria bacterium RIFOXYB12_FULL_58_9]